VKSGEGDWGPNTGDGFGEALSAPYYCLRSYKLMQFKNERSLERSLVRDFPGSKNVLDALEQAKRDKIQTPPEAPSLSTEYSTMKDAINQITEASKGFDFDSMDAKLRKDLSEIKTDSIEGIIKWRDSWQNVLRVARGNSRR
jgi:hypothetical protein